MLVFHKYYSDYYKNLDISSFDLAKQFSLNKESRFNLTKMLKLRSEVTNQQIKHIIESVKIAHISQIILRLLK